MASKVDTAGLRLPTDHVREGVLDNLDRRRKHFHRTGDIRSEIVILELIADIKAANGI